MQVQLNTRPHNPDKRRSIFCLILLAALSLALIAAGLWGMQKNGASQFDQEAAFGYVYKLSEETERAYNNDISPVLSGLGAEKSEAVQARAHELLVAAWSDAAKAAQSATLDTYLQGSADVAKSRMKLLSVTYAVAGPKVTSSEKKAMAARPITAHRSWRRAK